MSLRPPPITPVPAGTARMARTAFPQGNPYLTLRDALGTLFQKVDPTAVAMLSWRGAQPRRRPRAGGNVAVSAWGSAIWSGLRSKRGRLHADDRHGPRPTGEEQTPRPARAWGCPAWVATPVRVSSRSSARRLGSTGGHHGLGGRMGSAATVRGGPRATCGGRPRRGCRVM
jgi:transposase